MIRILALIAFVLFVGCAEQQKFDHLPPERQPVSLGTYVTYDAFLPPGGRVTRVIGNGWCEAVIEGKPVLMHCTVGSHGERGVSFTWLDRPAEPGPVKPGRAPEPQ